MVFLYLLFINLIAFVSPYCSSQCTYSFQSGTGTYSEQCMTHLNNTCKACDTRFYLPLTVSPGQCALNTLSIYNISFIVQNDDWVYNTTNNAPLASSKNPVITGGLDWVDLDDVDKYTHLRILNQPHYAIRCRVLFHNKNGLQNLYFSINNSYTQKVQIIPEVDADYQHQQWIYTSPLISHSDQTLRIIIQRRDSGAPTPRPKFTDTVCFVAQCTPNCLSCTSLTNCILCDSTTKLEISTGLCIASCLQGQFLDSGLCKKCDNKCERCTNSLATSCSKCTSSGPFQSFLQLDNLTCAFTCQSPSIPNYDTHECQCPKIGYIQNSGVCNACPSFCKYCTTSTTCRQCQLGYFLNIGSSVCSMVCPSGQYVNIIFELGLCLLCDSNSCVNCIISPTMCTSCNFTAPNQIRYLHNYTCVNPCPDGYEGNNSTFLCDICPLGTYSYNNMCFSQCPQYYTPNDNIRACVLSGGYPLDIFVQAESSQLLKFTIRFNLTIKPSIVTLLNATWKSYISLTFVTQKESKLVKNPRRLLASTASRSMAITNAIINTDNIVLYSNSVTASDLVNVHSFVVKFQDNILSPNDVIYSIRATTSTDDNPWFISKYFDLNVKPLFLIGAFLAIAGLLMILMRTKYVYRVLIEYIHCIQLLGLTFYAIYPHSIQVDLYSFLMGLDFANFSFMYNVPAKFISPCYDCASLISYSVAIGDMNWLRMMGSIILCVIGMFIFYFIISVFKCSKKYSQFYKKLIIDLILIKTIHGWFASLLYSGLNIDYNSGDWDFFMFSMHFLSYLAVAPVVYQRVRIQYLKKYPNISFLFLIVYIILLTLLSIAPSLICALLILTTITQWCLNIGLNINEEEYPSQQENDKKIKQGQIINSTVITDQKSNFQTYSLDQKPFILKFHQYFLRSLKITTAFLVACIILLQNQLVPIILVSVILAIEFLLIVVDAYYLYEHFEKGDSNKNDSRFNHTKQDLKSEKESQYRQTTLQKNKFSAETMNSKIVKDSEFLIYDEDDIDDDIVANKFKKRDRKKAERPNNQQGNFENANFFKNVD